MQNALHLRLSYMNLFQPFGYTFTCLMNLFYSILSKGIWSKRKAKAADV